MSLTPASTRRPSMDTQGDPSPHHQPPSTRNITMEEPPSLTGPTEAPDFKHVRNYLPTVQHREALGGFIRAGWSAAELAEFARQVYLAPGRTYPTALSYRHAMDKGADHPFAVETWNALRAPGATVPAFNRPVPRQFGWCEPDNPEHTPELRADIVELARLWRNREAHRRSEPWPTEALTIPRRFWKQLFRLRNKYHSLEDTIEIQGLARYRDPVQTTPETQLTSDPLSAEIS
jgi:hypothetical protein